MRKHCHQIELCRGVGKKKCNKIIFNELSAFMELYDNFNYHIHNIFNKRSYSTTCHLHYSTSAPNFKRSFIQLLNNNIKTIISSL